MFHCRCSVWACCGVHLAVIANSLGRSLRVERKRPKHCRTTEERTKVEAARNIASIRSSPAASLPPPLASAVAAPPRSLLWGPGKSACFEEELSAFWGLPGAGDACVEAESLACSLARLLRLSSSSCACIIRCAVHADVCCHGNDILQQPSPNQCF
jgi:hypothetical protein